MAVKGTGVRLARQSAFVQGSMTAVRAGEQILLLWDGRVRIGVVVGGSQWRPQGMQDQEKLCIALELAAEGRQAR